MKPMSLASENLKDRSVPGPILSVKGLDTVFETDSGIVKAAGDVSFDMGKGEIIGIVGESGSGKSVTALSIMRLIQHPGRIQSGKVFLGGKDLFTLTERQMQAVRGNRISMIFQEPMTSLNPLKTVGGQIAEMYLRHTPLSSKEAWDKATSMLEKVKIPSAAKRAKEFPHQMSGGMRQRVMIAMAMALKPEILIADEPTTALDVTIQAQVLDLMMHLKEDTGTGILMITHDLGVIAQTAKKVVVMYAGEIVEKGDVFSIFEDPRHPYTKALLHAVIPPGKKKQDGHRTRLSEIKGMVPNLLCLPPGCRFKDRCPEASDPLCSQTQILHDMGDGRMVRCIRYFREDLRP